MLARSAGASIQLTAREGNYAVLLMPSGELRRGHVSGRRVRARLIVVRPPAFAFSLRLRERLEPARVKQLVAQPAVNDSMKLFSVDRSGVTKCRAMPRSYAHASKT